MRKLLSKVERVRKIEQFVQFQLLQAITKEIAAIENRKIAG